MPVAEQGGCQVPGSRERRGSQTSRGPAACQQEGLESVLEKQRSAIASLVAELASKIDEFGAAGEVDVLTIVDLDVADGERGGLAAQQPATLQEVDGEPEALELEGSAQTGKAGPNHPYMA
jgi:hypothetical protein